MEVPGSLYGVCFLMAVSSRPTSASSAGVAFDRSSMFRVMCVVLLFWWCYLRYRPLTPKSLEIHLNINHGINLVVAGEIDHSLDE